MIIEETAEEKQVEETVSAEETTTQTTEGATPEEKAAAEEKEKESEKSREYHEQKAQTDYQNLLETLRTEDPDAYERVVARTKKTEAATTEEKREILDEAILTADIPVNKLLGMIEEAASRGILTARRKEVLAEEIGVVKRTLNQATTQFKSTREEMEAAVAEADDVLPLERCTEPGDLKRRARLIIKELNTLAGNRRKSERLETTKVEEQTRVDKVNSQQYPHKSSIPANAVEKTEKQKHLDQLNQVGPKSSRSLLDSQRK